MIAPEIFFNSFGDKKAVLDAIAKMDFWPFTLAVGRMEAEPLHHHPCDAWHFIIDGSATLHSSALKPLMLRGGDKVFIPRGCVHSIEVPDFVVMINALADPSMVMGPPKVYPDLAEASA